MACFFKNPSTNNYEVPCPMKADKIFRCDFLHDITKGSPLTTINGEVDTNNWQLNTRQNTHSTESLLHPLSDHGIHGTCCVYHCASHIATKYQSSLSPTASFHTPVRNTTIRTITQSSTPEIIPAHCQVFVLLAGEECTSSASAADQRSNHVSDGRWVK